MKPLYRFYMNFGIIVTAGTITFTLFHFFGPPSLVTLIMLVPFTILTLVSVNTGDKM